MDTFLGRFYTQWSHFVVLMPLLLAVYPSHAEDSRETTRTCNWLERRVLLPERLYFDSDTFAFPLEVDQSLDIVKPYSFGRRRNMDVGASDKMGIRRNTALDDSRDFRHRPESPILRLDARGVTDSECRTLIFRVVLSEASSEPVTGACANSDGSDQFGWPAAEVPYVLELGQGTLTLNPGEIPQPITVNLVKGSVAEGSVAEAFMVTLSNPTSATSDPVEHASQGGFAKGPVEAELSVTRASAEESATSMSFAIPIDPPSTQAVVVNVRTSQKEDDSATTAMGFQSQWWPVTIPLGSAKYTVDGVIVEDEDEIFTGSLYDPADANIAAGDSETNGTIVDNHGGGASLSVKGETPPVGYKVGDGKELGCEANGAPGDNPIHCWSWTVRGGTTETGDLSATYTPKQTFLVPEPLSLGSIASHNCEHTASALEIGAPIRFRRHLPQLAFLAWAASGNKCIGCLDFVVKREKIRIETVMLDYACSDVDDVTSSSKVTVDFPVFGDGHHTAMEQSDSYPDQDRLTTGSVEKEAIADVTIAVDENAEGDAAVALFLVNPTDTVVVSGHGRRADSASAFGQRHGGGTLEDDWRALIAVYNNTAGAQWKNNNNWSASTETVPTAQKLNAWHGVTVTDGRVTKLQLQANGLYGQIPSELGQLTSLTTLSLDNNIFLSGSIPPELGNLVELTGLWLYSTSLSGSIPPELGNLVGLEILWLNQNELSGTVPPELGNLTNMIDLFLRDNELIGELPFQLTNMKILQTLYFGGQELCAPATPAFQAWLKRVHRVTGPKCVSIIVEPAELPVMEGDLEGNSFNVRLATEPTADVAVTITGYAGTDLTVSPLSLAFTADTWETDQSVNVTAAHDDNSVDEDVTLELQASGGDYEDKTAEVVVTILDDDEALVVGIRNAQPVTEGEVAAFAVELTAASSQEVVVTYSTGRAGDTAEGGSDYKAALGQSLSIAAGDLSAVIAVQTHDDAIFEGPESFTVTLVGVSGDAILPDDPYATGTILDDETAPTIDIDAVPKMVVEDAGSVLVSVRLSVASDDLVKVRLATTEGTATAGADYVARSLEVVFASGETEESVSIAIVDDDLVEGDETFGVRLSAPSNGEIGREEVAVTILDNDTYSELAIERGVAVSEGAGRARFTVSLHPARSTEVRVDYATADVTATAGGDYDAASGTLVFEPGATQRTVDVTVVNDALVEPSETFRFNLDAAVGDAVIVDSTATGTIIDDDGTSALIVANLTVHEDAGTANVRVVLSPASDADVTVRYATSDGTATAGEDYGSTSDILAIPAGVTERIISVGILDDLAVESSETFMVTLSDASNADISRAAATVTIIDDDEPVLSIDDVVVDEDAPQAVFTARLDVPSVLPVTVQYASVDGTATAGLDYEVASGVIEIPPGDLHGEIRVTVIDDALTEGDETFTVVLSRATNAGLGDATGEAVIRDNDTYSLSVDDVTVSEADAEASFTVSLDRANPAQTVSVQYATSDATAAAGRDYEARSGTLEIDSGQLSETISVPILDDAEREGQETFFLSLSGAQNAEIADGEGTGTIVDDDEPAVAIADVRAWEGAGTMMFVVTLDGESAEEVSVGYQTREGTATEGVDYERAAGRLRFESAEVSKTIAVQLLDDAIDEPDEAFVMQLSDPEGAAIAAGEAAGTILDDDVPPVLGVVSAVTVGEGEGTAEFAVTLSAESALEVKASYATSDGTATAGEDYTGARGMLTIGPGETTGKVAVSILDDNVQESNETFVLTLSGVQGATPGNSASTATIVDNEVVPVLTIDDVTAAEDAGAAVFVVRLSGTTSLAVSVGYATSDETATAGGDYTETQGTLRFGATEVEKEIRVLVVADNLDEEDETFLVTLSGEENAVIGDGVGRGTIMDDDEPVTISIHDGRATEDAGILHLPVRLSRASSRVVSVFFETSDATAEAGSDYTASRGITIFERGSSEGVVAIAIADDALDEESEEAFQVTLSRPTNAVIVRGTGTGTIADDDGMPLLRVDDLTASEDGGEAVFVVWLSSPSERMVSVQYRTLDGTAEAGADYVMAAGTLVFAPGDVEEEVRVRLLRDGVDWRSETFSLALESATNVLLEDAVAVATIVEEESVEEGVLEAYLARMLRTSASHVVEAMGERMRWQQRDASCRSIAHRGLGMMRQVNPDWDPSAAELLSGCGLATRAEAGRGALSVWGRGAFTRVGGQEGALSLSANVTTAALGADYQWRSGLLAGLVLARSHGAGTFEAYAAGGETGSVLTGVYPYVSYRLRATNMWVMAGLGRGSADVTGSESMEAHLTSDLVAAGAVGRLVGGSRARLSYEADAFLARVRTEEMVEVGVRRLRAGLEASMTVLRSVRGYIEAGLRHDGGDAETGLGLEVGGGLRLARPGSRLHAELSSRGLVSHAASGFAEWGVAGALRYGAQGGLGPTAEIRPVWGPAHSGGWQALWRHDTVLDAMAGVPGKLHMEVELGYGTRFVVGEGVARPTLAVAVAERGKDYRLGYEVRPRRGLGLSVSGVARESVLPYLPVTYGISVRAAMQW